jgi:hypothetical protein
MLRIRTLTLAACYFFFCITANFTAGALPNVVQTTVTTCPSRTINYITQTLPQQCLRTSWTSNATIHQELQQSSSSNASLQATITSSAAVTQNAVQSLPGSLTSTEELSQDSSPVPASPTPTVADSHQLPHQLPEAEVDVENDPLSDNANFLSFEEWKAQMLEKAGQSPENIGKGHVGSDIRRRPSNINDASMYPIDALGEDTEIELDFSGFVNPNVAPNALPPTKTGTAPSVGGTGNGIESNAAPTQRSKDAGKTCKERTNYASFDCAATILKTNPECKGSTAVLVENKDSYMLNECSAKNKFFIVELCNDILIDTVVLGNFEFFSSTFKTFRVSVSDLYPVKPDKWKELGVFEARNSRDIQAFLVENPMIWARYMRIEFLTHYGNEYYCPVSLVRVHGKTMMDDYRSEVKASRGEDDDDAIEVPEAEAGSQYFPPLESTDETARVNITEVTAIESSEVSVTDTPNTSEINLETSPQDTATLPVQPASMGQTDDNRQRFSFNGALLEQSRLVSLNCTAERKYCHMEHIRILSTLGRLQSNDVVTNSNIIPNTVSSKQSSTAVSSTAMNDTSATTSTDSTESVEPKRVPAYVGEPYSDDSRNNTVPSPNSSSSKGSANHTHHTPSKVSQHPTTPSPTTQESFFKSVHKRLQLLEANSTLSLQYIEEQSRLLREAFSKVEKRQLAKTTTFLETLNTTVLSELREFRLQYDQIWQSTVLELSAQREQTQHDMIALSSRLSILADEILFQKRMVIFQFILILICLGLVVFAPRLTSASAAYFELPSTVHNMVSRPTTSYFRHLHVDSPPSSPSRPSSRYGIISRTFKHGPSPSNETAYEEITSKSSGADYRPPTPVSGASEDEETTSVPPMMKQSEKVYRSLRRVVSSPAIASESQEIDNDFI